MEQDNHYYPYGMMMGESGDILDMARPGSTTKQSDANPYLYGGKEYLTTAGANLLDFTARTYDPTILLFHTPDPLRDKYLPVHSYLYCGANPIMFTDPTGMQLQLSGSKEDIITTIRVYEKYTGGKLKFSVNETGIVSIQPCNNLDMKFSEAQEQCANVMMRVIEDNNLTSINIVNNSESIAIADAISSTIDIGDITALGDDYHVTSGYTLVHETWEQYKLQNGDIKSIGTKTDKDFFVAHNKAIKVENLISGFEYSEDYKDRLMDNYNNFEDSDYMELNIKNTKNGEGYYSTNVVFFQNNVKSIKEFKHEVKQ